MWVLVADRGSARILSRSDPKAILVEEESFTWPGGRQKGRDINTDAPGRVFDSAGQGRHAVGRADPADHEAETFARTLIEELDKRVSRENHRRVVIVAAPRFLGTLRQLMPKHLSARLAAEVDKDVVGASCEDLTALVSERTRA